VTGPLELGLVARHPGLVPGTSPTVHDSHGRLTVEWPNGYRQPFLTSPEAVEEWARDVNELRRRVELLEELLTQALGGWQLASQVAGPALDPGQEETLRATIRDRAWPGRRMTPSMLHATVEAALASPGETPDPTGEDLAAILGGLQLDYWDRAAQQWVTWGEPVPMTALCVQIGIPEPGPECVVRLMRVAPNGLRTELGGASPTLAGTSFVVTVSETGTGLHFDVQFVSPKP
jgi:hypothetical protein